MHARSHADLQRIRRSVERIRGLSDRMIGLGPFGVGMDAVLSLIPIPLVGAAYSGAAGVALMLQAVRAHASPWVLMQMGVILTIDTMLDAPAGTPVGPFTGLADTLFTGHKWAANLLLRQMDRTLYVEHGSPEHAEAQARKRSGRERRRLVVLG
jgi:hypothetical protein